MRYSEKRLIAASLCDSEAYLSPIGVLQTVEDVMTDFFRQYGIDGLTVKQKYNYMWVFTKNALCFEKPAQWGNPLLLDAAVVKVMPFGIQADICMRHEDGEIAAYSHIDACLVDIAEQKIVRPSAIGLRKEDAEQPEWVRSIEPYRMQDKEFATVERRRVRATNIDLSRHMNNIEYLRFLLDMFSSRQTTAKNVSEIHLHYLNQAFEGEELNLMRSVTDCGNWQITCGERQIATCRIVMKAE